MDNVSKISDARQSSMRDRQIVLVLQGGGALGAYHAGVYHALHQHGIEPDWIIGTSIGAINASLIAGNPSEQRLDALKEFWKRMAYKPPFGVPTWTGLPDTHRLLADAAARHSGFLQAQSRRLSRHPCAARRRQCRLLFDRSAGKDLAGTGRFQTRQYLHAAAHRRRRPCADQRDEIFRQPRRRDRRQAYPGLRCAAAGLSGRAHRRRALLGRRHSLQHADRGDLRRQSAQGIR